MNHGTVLRGITGRRFRLTAIALVTTLSACSADTILKVSDPDVATPSAFTTAGALPALFAGALGSFAIAYDGNAGDLQQVTLSGSLSDELINVETFPTRIEVDRRAQTVANTSLGPIYLNMTQARAASERAINGFQKLAATKADSTGYAEALALNGMAYILFAENYCGAVPVSFQADDGSFSFGVGLTTTQLLDSAIAKFSEAQANGGSSLTSSIANLAKVGKGRALLDKGDFTGAAAAVAGVPSNFQYLIVHSATTGSQNNGTWGLTVNVARLGQANRKGGNGLPFASDGDAAGTVKDPRVANHIRPNNNHLGFDGRTVQFVQDLYPARTSSSVVADGVEARLIEAEAALQTGGSALPILNALRADPTVLAVRKYAAGSLPPLAAAATPAGQVDQLFKERAYWMYLTSHRLGDLRRLIRQYSRPAETVFPTGAYTHTNGNYGTDVNTPVPQAEQNNPKYVAGSCVQSQP